jgi:hypothetical protein
LYKIPHFLVGFSRELLVIFMWSGLFYRIFPIGYVHLFVNISSMTELRILIATVFLLLLSVFTLSASADDDRWEVHATGSYEHEDSDRREQLQARRERLVEIRRQRKHTGRTTPIIIHTGSTQTGTVTPPKTPAPVVVKPVPVVVKKPTTPVVTPAPVPAVVTHSNTVSYRTPDGSASITFSATTKAGVITAASSTTHAGGTSGYYQDAFAQRVSGAVMGKKIAGLNLSAIAGASLTTASFEQFIAANF